MFWAEVAREVPVATPITGVVKVGLVCTTNVVPVPVWAAMEVALPTEVMGPVRLALVVTFPAVNPEAVPVTLVMTPEAGVPRAGVIKVGEVPKTKLPVPVVPVTEEARLAEVMVVARLEDPSVATRRFAVSPEKVMVPEEETPVAPVMAPAPVISMEAVSRKKSKFAPMFSAVWVEAFAAAMERLMP